MMQWAEIRVRPSRKKLRQFAGLWLLFFAGLAGWHYFVRGNSSLAVVLAVLAITVGPVGLLRPMAVRWIFVGWMILVFPIGWLVSRVLLAALYYGVVTPMALAFRWSAFQEQFFRYFALTLPLTIGMQLCAVIWLVGKKILLKTSAAPVP